MSGTATRSSGRPAPLDERRHATGLELTARGRITLLLAHLTGTAAWITGEPVTQLATAALAAPFLVDLGVKLFAKPRLAALIARRRVEASQLFVETIQLDNVSSVRHAHALEVEEPATAVWRDGGTVFIETLPASSVAEFELPACARRRGISESRELLVSSRHPFGMLRWQSLLRCNARFVAEPTRIDLPDEVLDEVQTQGDEPETVGTAAGQEFFALREYRIGDDARQVHARRSAQRRTLVARELRGGADRHAVIIVDLRRPPGGRYRNVLFGDHGLETRISTAASLLDTLRGNLIEATCVLIGHGGAHTFSPDEGRDFLDALAIARAVPYQSLRPDVFDDVGATAGKSYWIAAAGFDAIHDRQRLPGPIVLVGGTRS